MKHPGNALAAITCLLLSSLLAWWASTAVEVAKTEQLPEGMVADSAGQPIPVGDYRRIACASTIAAEVVPELVSVERIVLVPDWFRKNNPRAFRSDRTQTRAVNIYASMETLLEADAGAISINSLSSGGSEKVERMRELGQQVCDLGPMHGLPTLLANIRCIAAVLGVPERGEALAAGFQRRLQQVAAHVPEQDRKTALYVGTMGGSLSGGTEGSAYHDMLHYAGLIDAAAGKGFQPWPTYDPEQVLAMDPEVLVTDHGRTAALRAVPGFLALQAIRNNAIVELPPGSDTVGLGLLPATEHVCDAVYGSR